MHLDNACLPHSLFVRLLQVVTVLVGRITSQFCKPCDDKVSDLLVIWVARDQKHISSDTFLQHLFSRDSVVAKGQEDPRYVCLDYQVDVAFVRHSEGVEKIQHSLLNQDVNGLFAESEVNQG